MFLLGDNVVVNKGIVIGEFRRIGIEYDDPYWNWFFDEQMEITQVHSEGDVTVQGRYTRRSARVSEYMVKLNYENIEEIRKILLEIKEECGIS